MKGLARLPVTRDYATIVVIIPKRCDKVVIWKTVLDHLVIYFVQSESMQAVLWFLSFGLCPTYWI